MGMNSSKFTANLQSNQDEILPIWKCCCCCKFWAECVHNRWHCWPFLGRHCACDPCWLPARPHLLLLLLLAQEDSARPWLLGLSRHCPQVGAFQDRACPPPPFSVSGPAALPQIVAQASSPLSWVWETAWPPWARFLPGSVSLTAQHPTLLFLRIILSFSKNCKFESGRERQVTHHRTLTRPNSSRPNYLFVSRGILAFFSCSNLAGQVTKHLAAQLSGAMWPVVWDGAQ